MKSRAFPRTEKMCKWQLQHIMMWWWKQATYGSCKDDLHYCTTPTLSPWSTPSSVFTLLTSSMTSTLIAQVTFILLVHPHPWDPPFQPFLEISPYPPGSSSSLRSTPILWIRFYSLGPPLSSWTTLILPTRFRIGNEATFPLVEAEMTGIRTSMSICRSKQKHFYSEIGQRACFRSVWASEVQGWNESRLEIKKKPPLMTTQSWEGNVFSQVCLFTEIRGGSHVTTTWHLFKLVDLGTPWPQPFLLTWGPPTLPTPHIRIPDRFKLVQLDLATSPHRDPDTSPPPPSGTDWKVGDWHSTEMPSCILFCGPTVLSRTPRLICRSPAIFHLLPKNN